ncbi:FadR/GntR family transcriptional regulator [Nocardia cyriacigeorgica]|uniref:L-lactate utilization operon repressor n=1 Tax=Nocardia cyriacigeorgica TaxID=135487 RepID=A0A4U8VZH0_9NOCA|nr:FCD domain-containing protein [Nocardia cyriacigeorgica]MBF6101135.1 FadR family transcriptional regulator [Nocardia cyriacigeorgica]MBF6160548.1 FadR family transcriptional regulator [Nocardia cyriacigeorgica]MBF6199685.1 FadR family transcriptional regulator [Nocardia cyriacigeorgica]VFA97454.1 L-lactate utilization operon repressor [Nocardia cyriacigeorgica]
MSSQVRRHPLAEQAAELLLARIRGGEWPLGHRLPGETTLAAQLGVGRSTVREAIRELAGKGVLASRQGAGVFVTALDVSEEWDIVLRRATIASVIEARIAIEAEAAALAAHRRTPTDLRAIRRALAARSVAGQTVAEHVDADMEFHRAVLVAAHNDILVQLFDAFLPRLRLAMIDMLEIRPVPSERADHAAHEQLADAIAARNPAAAAEFSRTHLTALKEAFS